MDFKQAVDRNKLYIIMLDFNIFPKLVRLTHCTMANTRCRVKVDGQLTDDFEVLAGLKQGDRLALKLFNLILERVMRRTTVDTNATLMNRSVQVVGYADDLNILGRSVAAVEETFGIIVSEAKKVGLRVNESKTKLMIQSRKRRNGREQNIALANHNLEVVSDFTYLGSNVNSQNDKNQEIQKRIAIGNRTLHSLIPILKSRNIHRDVKLRLYKTLIRTIICYGNATWSITRRSSELLDRFERKILRKIFGPVNEQEISRIR